MFDFEKFNVIGYNSMPNQLPFFCDVTPDGLSGLEPHKCVIDRYSPLLTLTVTHRYSPLLPVAPRCSPLLTVTCCYVPLLVVTHCYLPLPLQPLNVTSVYLLRQVRMGDFQEERRRHHDRGGGARRLRGRDVDRERAHAQRVRGTATYRHIHPAPYRHSSLRAVSSRRLLLQVHKHDLPDHEWWRIFCSPHIKPCCWAKEGFLNPGR